MLHLSSLERYYFYSRVVDMRKVAMACAAWCKRGLRKIYSAVIFSCSSTSGTTRLNYLEWDRDGFALYEKRLEKGTFEQPVFGQNSNDVLLTNLQLQHILQRVIYNLNESFYWSFRYWNYKNLSSPVSKKSLPQLISTLSRSLCSIRIN